MRQRLFPFFMSLLRSTTNFLFKATQLRYNYLGLAEAVETPPSLCASDASNFKLHFTTGETLMNPAGLKLNFGNLRIFLRRQK